MDTLTESTGKQKLFNYPFIILCLSSILFMMSFSMIMPELPGLVENMGGTEYFGYIFGLFTISAGISRFWSGRFADIIGRRKIILFGTLITAICGVLYIYTITLTSFFILRFIHGLSTGWRPTGSTAYVIDVIPQERMGEGMGFLGMAGSTGMALGPVIGSILQEDYSYEAMFITSSIVGAAALLLSFALPESLENTRKLEWKDWNIFKGKTLDFSTLAPSVVMLLDTFSFGVIITLSPKLMSLLGFTYEGIFNGVFVCASIITRFIAGKSSDKHGRIKLMKIGLILLTIALLLIGFSRDGFSILSGAVVLGVAIGINRPTIFAWTADMADPKNRAASMATMLLALEIGIGSGSFLSGSIYDGTLQSITISFVTGAVLALLAFLYILNYEKKTI